MSIRLARCKEALRSPAVQRLGKVGSIVGGSWFFLAFIGMFFTERFPILDPLVTWTFRLYLGSIAALIIGFTVIGPGVYVAGEFIDHFRHRTESPLEARLTTVWCVGTGVLFSAVLASAVVLICRGVIADVKLWFLGLCWVVVVAPWVLLGIVGRRVLRAYLRASSIDSKR